MNSPLAFSLAALLLCGCAPRAMAPVAQSAAQAQATPGPLAPIEAPPRVVTLPGAVCDPARTAETILKVQPAANRLLSRLQADPAFGGAWFEHAPCYRLVVAFADGQPRQWVSDAAEPELRPYLAFGRTTFSPAERESARMEIMAAVAAAGARTSIFISSIDPEQFTVGVPTEADASIARQAIPARYRSITRVEVGNFTSIPER